MQINLESMAIAMPAVAGHPNRLPFRGVLTLLDVPSEKPPAGARGHRVLLTRAAAERALPSLLGMALDFTPNLDGHDARRKVGVITSAEIVAADGKWQMANGKNRSGVSSGGNPSESLRTGARRDIHQLEIGGYIFARDFPDVVERMHAGSELGMSYEIANARVVDANAAVWTLTEATFTGAAMLLRSKAAYPATWIELQQESVSP